MDNKEPKLRFPGFEASKGKMELFGKYIISISYGPRFNSNDYSVNGNVKTIRGTDVSLNGKIKYSQVPIALLDQHVVENHVLEFGDLVMITTADCGLTGIFEGKDMNYICSAYAVKIKLNKLSDPFFYKYYFQTENSKNQVNKFIRKATVSNLPASDIKNIKLHIPSLPEQQKIANYLTTIDRKIELLKEKKELLKQYKKAMMQQLFSQQIRFRDDDGNGFPDWEEKEIEEVATSFNGLVGKTKENFGKGMPFITYTQIFNNSKIDFSKCDSVEIIGAEKQNKVTKGDAFFTISSETPHEIGMSSVLLDDVGVVYLNSFCFGIRMKSTFQLVPEFYRYLFRSSLFRKEVVKLAQGSTRYNMSKIAFMKIKISYPSILEQHKIADFLTTLDTSIEKINEQIDQTKSFKKAMLQQLFV